MKIKEKVNILIFLKNPLIFLFLWVEILMVITISNDINISLFLYIVKDYIDSGSQY